MSLPGPGPCPSYPRTSHTPAPASAQVALAVVLVLAVVLALALALAVVLATFLPVSAASAPGASSPCARNQSRGSEAPPITPVPGLDPSLRYLTRPSATRLLPR
ncbi:hypothetical protein HETIRDRAFT_451440 [Heterobasidion irregulare TC 32-1]|uniref:Uncharacterized protein n=1 Tax=Heterobasidion irregulare (strain TC 32-1) TaxID=747525 RepID=W4K7H5_HETIT|nr:uncharacterized protein HETIRDRAFT_451440 [Heterobasidion irregulare TC 32-1]ETW81719.1 hypothetical protein HETIRDRAFT_451440 [Heterobasidion irregulare TC 32-1]